jgi:thiosulfate/3-mercaptopyruvate sulfurtransferase
MKTFAQELHSRTRISKEKVIRQPAFRRFSTTIFDIILKAVLLTAVLVGAGLVPVLRAAPPQDNNGIPASALIKPEELAKLLKEPARTKPLPVFVGFRPLYVQAHIPGSEYAGPAAREENIQRLKTILKSTPKKKLIVLYCGCCPWSHCPNILPAYQAARAMGFTQLKVLYIPQDFGRDWLAKGYPVQTGE